ncbi:RNA-binding protein asd-2 [Caenorhabditis elegans]|uniref:RNA-binding protein asd-2 n=1 Tax=Caenorhabditis elegans TaxID=6239 RepID=ASD2_CAEEL|nr:RNA-binding protein asd-2 [Caenorhabditis elegans]G5EFF1.1 RecName: Full=RNA-binding protein asd-2; AltName: Full=Alternative splicing defective protein 2 [Caenorhabditis elegans]ABU96120.1 alternative splicing defective family member 2b [Caenorhabditis elegans]CCD67595.1 RNA-binding protein asd-2 [Caenorhabditis elegans]|eukprot:NP_001021627.1 RNA-binding protein asd-2 [Caenorhabditis elegans]
MDCDNGVVSEISDDKELLNLETVIPPPPNDSGHEFIGPSSGPPQVTITPSGVQSGSANGVSTSQQQQYSAEYLSQLLKDKKQLAAFPNVFHHLERLADEEINKVRVVLFQCEFSKESAPLPDAEGDSTVHTEKVFVPAKEHPDYNFVGRILGPRGMTAKQLEQETGCKIMVRGRGSMRDKKKEELNRGKPNWEHLSEELHVLIQCEDTENRAKVKLMRAVEEVRKLLVPAPEGEDDLKRKQLMELAIINGTYRSGTDQSALAAAQLAAVKHQQQPFAAALQAAALQRGVLPMMANGLSRSPTMAVCGAPIVMSPSGRASSAGATATSQAALIMQQQSQLHAANAGNAALQQQAALLQQQQAAEYQQLLLSQAGLYDFSAMQQQYAAVGQNAAVAAAQAQAQAQYGALAAAAAANSAGNQQYADYAGVDLTSQQSAHGGYYVRRWA